VVLVSVCLSLGLGWGLDWPRVSGVVDLEDIHFRNACWDEWIALLWVSTLVLGFNI